MAYRREDGAASERTVRPLALHFWGGVWTLAVWCEMRDDFRSFRLDRMERLVDTGETFAAEPGKRVGLVGRERPGHAADFLVRQQAGARRERHAMFGRQRTGAVLEAEGPDILRRRADEHDTGTVARLGELGILGQEAVARMNGARAGLPRSFQDRRNVEIALRCRCRANADGNVRLAHMQGIRVRL